MQLKWKTKEIQEGKMQIYTVIQLSYFLQVMVNITTEQTVINYHSLCAMVILADYVITDHYKNQNRVMVDKP